jgi:anti-sigma regulatory factor (Ser/Thr protein kinase)
MVKQNLKEEIKIPINNESDVQFACKKALELAHEIGFSEIEQCEIEIIISELGAHIIKHADKRGLIRMLKMKDKKGLRLEIVAVSNTKVLKNNNLKEWIRCGRYTGQSVRSTTEAMGIGLSAITKLADSFDIKIRQNGELTANIRKKLRPKIIVYKTFVISKPKAGEIASGDGHFVLQNNESLFFVL